MRTSPTGQSRHRTPLASTGPLSIEETARAERVARRMQAELARVVDALPPPARAATEMSRHLGLARNTCQRVVAAVADTSPEPRLLGRLPGVEGLRQFVEAVRAAGVENGRTAALSLAVDEFASAIAELAGSQSRLIKRLQAAAEVAGGRREPGGLASEPARRRLFEGAVDCVGRSLDLHLSILAFRRRSGPGEGIESFAVTGLIGYRARADGMPLLLEYGDTIADAAAGERHRATMLDEAPAEGRTPQAVLEAFSTSPPPVIVSQDASGELYQMLQPAAGEQPEGGPVDIVLAHRASFVPRSTQPNAPPLDQIWALMNTPARHLLLDVYLDRELAAACVPSMDAQLWLQDLNPKKPWATRLPHTPPLEFLGLGGPAGQGLRDSAAEAIYPRHGELTSFILGRVGWSLRDLVGYRCSMPYPVWRAGYRMSFGSLA